jgi:GT2 family glycosyltransferase
MGNGAIEQQGDRPLVSVVIVNYNSGGYLTQCVRSLLNSTYPKKEVIIVDNASNDDSVRRIEALWSEITVLKNPVNLGFARAGNIGIFHSKGELVTIINPDTVVERDWLQQLMDATQRYPGAAFFQPKILLMDNPRLLNSAGNMIHIAGFGLCRGIGRLDSEQFQKETEVCYTSGACTLARRKTLDKIGPMEDLFFAYGEDKDWGWRALMMGWRSIYIPTAIVLHKWSPTLADTSAKFYLLEFERVLSIWKNYSTRTVILLMPTLLLVEVSVLLYAILRGWLIEKIRSYADLLRLRRIVAERRRIVQERRVVPDGSFVRRFALDIEHPYLGSAGAVFNQLIRLLVAPVSNSI